MRWKPIFLLFLGILLNFFIFLGSNSAFATAPGDVLWAKSTTVAPNGSIFYSSATDSLGNIYAVGKIVGNGQFDFGNSVTVSGAGTIFDNAVLVKYNSNGLGSVGQINHCCSKRIKI